MLAAAAGLIVWHFWGGRGDVLKADGGPVVTVMDFAQSFPLDPLPSGRSIDLRRQSGVSHQSLGSAVSIGTTFGWHNW
jgi:hypothetical protein